MMLTSPLSNEYGGSKRQDIGLACAVLPLLYPRRRPISATQDPKAPLQVRRRRMRLSALDQVSTSTVLGPTGFCGRREREEYDAMREIEIHDYARQLLEAHGPKAIAEAAQNAIELEAKGEVELAKTWRHIEDAMKIMRGPHQS